MADMINCAASLALQDTVASAGLRHGYQQGAAGRQPDQRRRWPSG
jgi:hypothetical protein